MPVRTRYHKERNQGKTKSAPFVERLPQPDMGQPEMPNPGRGTVTDPETRRRVPVPKKRAPKPRTHQRV